MENHDAHVDEVFKIMLKQKALVYLPRNLAEVDAQRQILDMLVPVIPAISACKAQAEQTLWPRVSSGELTMGQAVAQCAYQADKAVQAAALTKNALAAFPRETLMKVWIAMDYYGYVLKAEYAVNIHNLQNQIASVLMSETAGHSQNKAPVSQAVPVKPAEQRIPVSPEKPVVKPVATPAAKTIDYNIPSKPKKAPAKSSGKKLVPLIAAVLVVVIVAAFFLLSPTFRTQAAIRKIGEVTLESEELIVKAEELYNALEEDQQEKVKNSEDLFDARAQYDALVTEDAIDAIGKVTMESKDAIAHAGELYEALSRDARNLVGNYKKLTDAQKELARLEEAVEKASAAIDAIGTVTLESGDKIREARKAYDDLSKDNLQKYLADKLPTLTKAEDEFKQLHSQDLFDTGMAYHEEKKYEEAIACFDTIIADYADTDLLDDARKAKADSQTELANQAYKKKDYYTALKTLDSVDAEYQQLDNHKSLRDKVMTALEKARPKNGTKLAGSVGSGRCYFKATAGNQDVVIKIQNVNKTSKYTMIYLRAGKSKTIKVSDGTYSVKYATGSQWFDKTHLFGDDTECRDAGTVALETTYKGNKVYYYSVTLDLSTPMGSIININDF